MPAYTNISKPTGATYTSVSKPTGSSYTNIAKPSGGGGSMNAGMTAGLLMPLTRVVTTSTPDNNWTKVAKPTTI